jgi:hypothetical protein
LIELDLSCNEIVTDNGLKWLTKLTSLNLCLNKCCDITDASISLLTDLTFLDIGKQYSLCDQVTDASLRLLTKLTGLHIDHACTFTNEALKGLTNLTELTVSSNRMITDEGVALLHGVVFFFFFSSSSFYFLFLVSFFFSSFFFLFFSFLSFFLFFFFFFFLIFF